MTTVAKGIYDYLRRYIDDNGYAPTLREIVEETDASSTSHASYHLDGLEVGELITRTKTIARGIRITDPTREYPE